MASITGAVVGNIYAKQISLEANSTVQGDIYYETLGIHENAVINGRLIQQSAQDINQNQTQLLPLTYTHESPEQLVVSEYKNETPVYIPSSKAAPSYTSNTEFNGSTQNSYSPKRVWRKK